MTTKHELHSKAVNNYQKNDRSNIIVIILAKIFGYAPV